MTEVGKQIINPNDLGSFTVVKFYIIFLVDLKNYISQNLCVLC